MLTTQGCRLNQSETASLENAFQSLGYTLTKDITGCHFWPISVELMPETGWHLYAPKSAATTEVGQGKPSIVSLVPHGKITVCSILADEAQLVDEAELREAGAVEGPVVFTLQVEPPKENSNNVATTLNCKPVLPSG